MMVGYRVEGMACRFLEEDYNFWQEGCWCCSFYKMIDCSLNLAVDCRTEVGRSFGLVQACMACTEMVKVVHKRVWKKGCNWLHSYYHIVA